MGRRITLRAAAWLAAVVVGVTAPAGSADPGADQVVGPRPVCCTNGMAIDGDLLYVNHAALDAVDVIDVATGSVTPLASEADADGEELVTPDDIWRDPLTGDLYITEILVNGVRRISPDGTRTRVMSGFGDGTAHPNAITGLRRPGQPLRLFISMVSFEPGSSTGIWEIDPSGVVPPRLVYGAAGGRAVFGHGMRAPNAFAFDPDGRELFVPESYGGAVYAVDVDAHTARLVYSPPTHGPQAMRPNGIALRFSHDGSILYAEQDTGRLLRLDPAGPPSQVPAVVAQLDPGIDGIAEHSDGRIFMSNFRFGGVSVVDPSTGNVSQLFKRSLNLPNSLAEFPDGRLAVGDLGSLALVDPSTGAIERPKQFIRDDFDIAVGVATLGDCDAYATGFFRGTLQHVDVCDASRPHTEIVPRRTFVAPWDVAVSNGDMWVSDAAGTVWRLTGVSGSAPARAVPLPAVFDNPTGIAVHGDRLYVSESGAGRIRVLDRATALPAGVIDGLDEPEGLAYDDCSRSLYVVEAGAGRLIAIDDDGNRTVVREGLATGVRGVSVVPVLNFFADVHASQGEVFVTTPGDGALVRIPTVPPDTFCVGLP